jgi:hypothetical protein
MLQNSFWTRLKMPGADCPRLGAGLSVPGAKTERRARLCSAPIGGLSEDELQTAWESRISPKTDRLKIASNQNPFDVRPNKNQLPPNFNYMVTRQ